MSPLTSNVSRLTSNFDYIKHFTKYLIQEHLSPLTVKSYKSDITRYVDWGATHLPSTELSKLLTAENIEKYLNYLSDSSSTLPSTIDRKEKSIKRFATWLRNTYPPSSISDNNQNAKKELFITLPLIQRSNDLEPIVDAQTSLDLSPDIDSKRVKNSNYRNAFTSIWNPNLRNFISLAILLIFVATLAIFGYRQFSRDASLIAAFPSTPVTPNRQLSFQGRLENASGTPITVATNLTFKLWDQLSGGTEGSCVGGAGEDCLYTTGICSITPDSDGVFSTQIGSSCGAAIPATVFTENANIFLEVVVAAETLTPRQPIASVAYALNSETIQGFPISSTVSAIRNTVVPMNQWGEIIIGEQSPRMTGVSGTFAISAPSISITTTTGSNGNITLAPDGTGQVHVNGNTTSTNFFNVSNAQLTTGSLITGTAANNNTGFKLLNLLSGSSPTSKFSVADTGNVTLAGDLTITGDDLFMTTNTSGFILVADGTNYNPTAVTGDITLTSGGVTAIGATKLPSPMLKVVDAAVDEECLTYEATVGDFEWQTCGSGGSGSNWRYNLGTLSPLNDTVDLLIGGNATSSAKISFININSGTPTINLANQASNIAIADNAASAFKIGEGANTYLDITTTNNAESFTLNLPVGGVTSHTANLFNANIAQTINMGTGTAIDTINIGTGGTGADLITLGSANAGNVSIISGAALGLTGGTGSFINFPSFDVATTGAITTIDGVAHTIDDVAGDLTLTSNSTTVVIADDLAVNGN
jgi:hypothetical protein